MVNDDRINQKVEAQAFDAPDSNKTNGGIKKQEHISSTQTHTRLEVANDIKWWHSQFNLMVAVFSLLVAAALLFVVLTPAPSIGSGITPAVTLINQDGEVSKSANAATSNSTEQTPWDEQRRAQARVDAQDILSGLLNSKKILEAQDVQKWAGDVYQSALALADQGDAYYKQQDYRSAITSYESAAEQMQNLQTKLPELLEENIKDGFSAIEQGKSGLAKQRFQQALVIDNNSIRALKGLGRAETLDQVLALYAQGQDEQQLFLTNDKIKSLSAAKAQYQQALELDKDFVQAKDAIKDVSALESDKHYRQAMTKGFNSLFSKRYSSAKSAFANALKIKPNDVTAKQAYTQSLSSNRSASLTSLLSAAKKHEINEQWSSALSGYQVVLQRDANQVSAKLGQIRSRTRSDLDDRLVSALSDPLALSKASVRAKAEQALSDAQGISRKGDRLNQQINQLKSALGDLNQTVKFVLSSDSLTKVSLIKVGSKRIELGEFATKNLALKPGRYVVQGVRLGYKDVRKEIEVVPGAQEVKSIFVRCTEPVNDTATLGLGSL